MASFRLTIESVISETPAELYNRPSKFKIKRIVKSKGSFFVSICSIQFNLSLNFYNLRFNIKIGERRGLFDCWFIYLSTGN